MMAPAGPKPPAEAKAAPKVEEKPLPESVADWKEEHYLQARRKKDNRLTDAVKQIGQQATGGADAAQAEKTAALLTKLLKAEDFQPPPTATPAPGTAPAGSTPYGPPMSAPSGMTPTSSPTPPGMSSSDSSSSSTSETCAPETSSYSEAQTAEITESVSTAEAQPQSSSSAEMSSSDMPQPTTTPGMTTPGSSSSPYGGAFPPMGPMGPMGPGGQPQGPVYQGLDPATITAIVECLAAMGNDTARQTLSQILAGKLKTDNDRAAVEAVLEGMVANLRPEYENVLFAVLTTPEKVRPSDKPGSTQPGASGPQTPMSSPDMMAMAMQSGASGGTGPGGASITAEQMQKKALALIEPIASEQFRVKLANYLIVPTVPDAQRSLLGRFLTEEKPENAAAQLIVHGQEQTDGRLKTALEGYFGKFSSTALAGILGIPADQVSSQPSGMSGQSSDGSQPPRGSSQSQPGAAPAGQGGWTFGFGTGPSRGMTGMGMPSSSEMMMGATTPGGSTPSGPSTPLPPRTKPSDPELPYRLAKIFWAQNFATPVQQRLKDVESLEKDTEQILFASTMPLAGMRTTLFETLRTHWESGPHALLAPGVLDRVVSEPGFVTVVKTLPRKDLTRGRVMPPRGDMSMPGSSSMGPGDGSSARPGGRSGMADKRAAAAEKAAATLKAKMEREQLGADWMKTSEHVVRALCRRLFAAAKARAKTADKSGIDVTAGRDEMPIELPAKTEPAFEYHLNWPGEVQQKLSGIPLEPFKLHYVRIMDRRTPRSAVAFYKAKMIDDAEHPTDLGVWLESFRNVPNSDNKLSIDVLVTRAVDMRATATGRDGPGRSTSGYGPGMGSDASPTPYGPTSPGTSGPGPSGTGRAPMNPDEVTDLVVEILTIEMKGIEPSGDESEEGEQVKKAPAKKARKTAEE